MKKICKEIFDEATNEFVYLLKVVHSIKDIRYTDKYTDQNRKLYDLLNRKESVDWGSYAMYRSCTMGLYAMDFLYDWCNRWEIKINQRIKWYHFVGREERMSLMARIEDMRDRLISES